MSCIETRDELLYLFYLSIRQADTAMYKVLPSSPYQAYLGEFSAMTLSCAMSILAADQHKGA